MFFGIFLNYSGIKIPIGLEDFLNMFVKFALPMVLISLGIALANFKIRSNLKSSLVLTFLKNLLHPTLAFIISQ